MTNAVTCYDFTRPSKEMTHTEMCKILSKHSKKWTFQSERGTETGYEHYQGRFSLKVKKRLKQVITLLGDPKFHVSITSTANKDNDFYVTKDDTRIEGPWSNKEYEEIYIPRQIREISKLYPWQEKIIEISKVWDTRHINIIVDTVGNIGKTTLKTYIRCHRIGRCLPFCNNYKDIMRMVCDMPTSKMYVLDMPRAIDKERLGALYSAIESIKDGYAYDDRYSFKEKIFDCPNIWVFTNTVPDLTYMSPDRWKFWEIKDGLLETYKERWETLGATL